MPGSPHNQAGRLWWDFEGRPSDEFILGQKGVAYAPLLMKSASTLFLSVKELIKLGDPSSSEIYGGELFAECLIADLHVTDKLAFVLLGDEKRCWFFDPLFQQTLVIVEDTLSHPGLEHETQPLFCGVYNSRIQRYAQLDAIARPNDAGGFNVSGSIGHELAKNIGWHAGVFLSAHYADHYLNMVLGNELMELLLGYAGCATYRARVRPEGTR